MEFRGILISTFLPFCNFQFSCNVIRKLLGKKFPAASECVHTFCNNVISETIHKEKYSYVKRTTQMRTSIVFKIPELVVTERFSKKEVALTVFIDECLSCKGGERRHCMGSLFSCSHLRPIRWMVLMCLLHRWEEVPQRGWLVQHSSQQEAKLGPGQVALA